MNNSTPPPLPNSQNSTSQPVYIVQKRSYIWLWFLVCILLFIFGCGFLFVKLIGSMGDLITKFEQSETEDSELVTKVMRKAGPERIAVIDVAGVISDEITGSSSMADRIIKRIYEAQADPKVKAVVLNMNTPGGGVTPSDNIYHAVLELKKTKPVVVYMDTLAASGGYYISCAADKIIANPTTLTGSIGVIISGYNATELMGKIGVKSQTFTSGAFKDMLSPTKDMSQAEKDYVQLLVDQAYARFLNIVVTGRKTTAEKLISCDLGNGRIINAVDGRILSAEDAQKAGLVDEIGYLEDAISAASQASSVKNPTIIRYTGGFWEDLMGAKTKSPELKVNLPGAKGVELHQGVPYMIPAIFVAQP